MNELIKTRVANLISLRQSLLGLLPILVGGTIGMFFINGRLPIRLAFISAGIIVFIVVMKGLRDTIIELNQYLYKNKRGQK